jgi:capsular polysaccharide biosynthesis protein
VNDENENVTMLSPQELQEKASYIQMIERNKINIAIGVGILVLGGIGFVIYRHKMKQKAATEIKIVKNGRRKVRVR